MTSLLASTFPVIMDAHHRSRRIRLTVCFFINLACIWTLIAEGLSVDASLDARTVVCHLWCSNVRHIALGCLASFTFFNAKYFVAALIRPQRWVMSKANITREFIYPPPTFNDRDNNNDVDNVDVVDVKVVTPTVAKATVTELEQA